MPFLSLFPVSLTIRKKYEIYTDALKNWEECNICLKKENNLPPRKGLYSVIIITILVFSSPEQSSVSCSDGPVFCGPLSVVCQQLTFPLKLLANLDQISPE